ncbi:MAG: hypothetical protein NTZ48_07355 [Candidatus Omnitrophica bacterium]|nr:hypothetical protein [Candidatus Omnitrophota bacterium]
MNKRIPIEKVLKVNRLLRNAGINVVHNFLFGIPTEKDEDTKENIDLMKAIKEVNPHSRANCYILSPIPGTPIFEFAKSLVKNDIPWTLRITILANELFAEINAPATDSQKAEIGSSKRLSYIFGDLDKIRYPDDKKKKYILNEVIMARDDGKEPPKIEPF